MLDKAVAAVKADPLVVTEGWTSMTSGAEILRRNVYGWFLRVERGKYALTQEGTAALSRWQARRRFAAHLGNARNRLRPLANKSGSMRAETVIVARPNRDQNAVDRPAQDDALISGGTIQHRDRGESSCA
jgi:hypothetical protein